MGEINVLDILANRQYKRDFIPDPENIVFTIQGKTIGSLQNYVTLAGLPKSGKSNFLSALVSTIIGIGDLFTMKLTLPNNREKLIYFDTESADTEFYAQAEKIKKFGGWLDLSEKIQMYQVREDGPGMIRKMIETLLEQQPEISVVVVDGLLDLCINYNDERETRLLTNWIKRITKQYNILFISVIHLGKKDGETLGHLGSNSDRWAQSTLTISKDKINKTMVLEAKYLRSADDIEPIIIQNISGNWYQVNNLPDIDDMGESLLINSVLQKECNYKTLVNKVQELTKRGQNHAKNLVKKWQETGRIEKTQNGYAIKKVF